MIDASIDPLVTICAEGKIIDAERSRRRDDADAMLDILDDRDAEKTKVEHARANSERYRRIPVVVFTAS